MCNQLILNYEPDNPKNNVCTTDLTQFSTNCTKKILSQKNYKLFDIKNIEQGSIDAILNTMIYKLEEDKIDRISVHGSKVITLFLPTGIEIYSLTICNLSFIPDPNNPTIKIGNFKLTQVSDTQTYTNLQYILTNKDGKETTRFLIFS